ncbi:MAG: peptidase S41 [Duncaniella sp.]|uniref:S41 family peptidase n=1 Tax=Duncaniella sp. TaxID=2518496 RepID=UPI0023C2CC57|nr:S41 family peptidase [Duncaniella sp.]MDE5989893.1 peptidase S41 [Duncaniella sp.]
MKKRNLLAALLLGAAFGAGAVTPMWLRDVRISPDGSKIAFTYKGDIFTVPANGGSATRLTSNQAYEAMPVWSPDGKKIAFTSDREGNADIYIMDANGGEATRLTFNSVAETPWAFTPDGSAVVYSAAIQDAPGSLLFPASWQTELYQVPVSGGRPVQILSTPAEAVSYLPDGKSFVYVDRKGLEDEWRKHHTSSVTRDLWKYDASTGRHTNLTARAGEDRNPVVSPDGKTLWFLSERDGGSFNVYSAPADDLSKATRLTNFTTHPVRFLSRGADGTLAFTYDGEIYTMRPGSKPAKVKIDVTADQSEPLRIRNVSGAGGAVASPDGKQVAFSNRGDIFVTSVDYQTTRQITSTPAAESAIAWGKDNRTLYYTSDRDGHLNIYSTRIGREADPNFPNATLIEESAVFPANDRTDRATPVMSPDGKKMAFTIDRRDIAVMDMDSKKVRRLTNGNICNDRDGQLEYSWSPDGKWLVAVVDMHRRSPYFDIAIINATDGSITNITNTAYMNDSPRWVMGGDAILFLSNRYGMRSHASWGSQYDVLLAFTNQAAYDRYRLSPEDFNLQKELKASRAKAPAKADAKASKDSKKKAQADSTKNAKSKTPELNIELEGISDRIVRLTPFSAMISDAYIDDKGETLWFLAQVDNGYDLWKKDLRKGNVSLASKLGARPTGMQPTADGRTLFLTGGGSIRKMALPGGKVEGVSFSATQKFDAAAEREYMYDYMLTEAEKRFFDPAMSGVDWKAMGKAYRKFLPHITYNADFAELTSEILGELNVSHSGGRYYPQGAREATASFGLLYDLTHTGPGLKVGEVLAGGPFDHADSAMKPGAVITAINGTEIDAKTDPTRLFNSIAGRKTLVAFTLPSGAKEEEVILPVKSGAITELLYNRWVKRNAHLVDSLSKGRLGYVHIKSMNDASYRTIYADLLGKYNECDGIVIDTRYNGGGRLHEDIEVLFSGKKYLTQEIKGETVGEMPSRRWNKPSIMLTCEANYSNAHGTPWVYRHMKLGKIVGMPVPGTMSSVNWIDMQDPSLVFGIPVIGFRTAEGNYLENTQLEPDVKVANDPARITRGIDDQLTTAVETLLKDLK